MLHVHIICLNYDGNAFDLCLLAAIAALEDGLGLHFLHLPMVTGVGRRITKDVLKVSPLH